MATQDDTTFTYDDVSGQVTKETTKLTKNKDVVKNYTYDSAGNKSAFAVKVGDDTKLSLQYTYDGASKLTAVTDEDGKVVDYSYDTDGNLSERTVAGNSMTTTYAYDYQNRLTSLKNQTGKGVISEYTSQYLTNGQKAKETADTIDEDGKKSKKTATYTYDLLGRITKEKKTGCEDISYTYDSNNNRKEMTVGNKVTAYKYNKNDELLRTDTLNTDTEKDSVVVYKNDKNGNQLATVNRYEIPSDKKDSSYVDIDVTLGDNRLNENVVNHYNALNQLTQTLTKNYKVSFTYDAEGLRTSKTVNGEKTVFVWDGDQLVMELSESGKVQKRYVRGNDLVYADKGENTEKKYYVTDPHGNVVQLTDESGKVTKTYEYDSFGNEVNPDSKDENPFRYCGEYYDKETEEIYLRARYYQPAVGRFLTRDTYTGEEDEPESLHLYTYCENDGVNAWDPSGNDAIAIWQEGNKIAQQIASCDGGLPYADVVAVIFMAGTATIASGDAFFDWLSNENTSNKRVTSIASSLPTPKPYILQESQIGANPKPGPEPTMLPKGREKFPQKNWKSPQYRNSLKKVLSYKIVKKWIDKIKKVYKKRRYHYGRQINVSSKKMYKLGKHFNKHGHKMGYKSKREYEKGARKFIEKYIGNCETRSARSQS